ncbi:hypothetical protein NPIL_171061 [Nephila pilipes]|uniref:Uncharacterized protein n=1 Tax=Nephila pilipes TaxID=299642 RepID=A0A8X6MY32_NEPPI|nr:hypothetical protein NPIL_171061 [Nephila pilipes]
MLYYKEPRKPVYKYKFGDHVALKRTQNGTGLKLGSKFFGLYEIMKIHHNDRYEVRKLEHHKVPNRASTVVDKNVTVEYKKFTYYVDILFSLMSGNELHTGNKIEESKTTVRREHRQTDTKRDE